MAAYYNEHDPKAAAWLRELIKQGHIALGDVDERSIEDVSPSELTEYTQCHFFAGIGVWSYALRQAGWPDDRPVWTGSCPCQPFSAAGKGAGFADERHLWPAFYHLISQCRPGVVFGEQVASKDGLAWLDLVQADLEGAGYAVGASDICAAGFGAPHIRQRLYWVADAQSAGLERFAWNGNHSYQSRRFHPNSLGHVATSSVIHGLADAKGAGKQRELGNSASTTSQRREGQSQPGGGASGDGAEGAIRRTAQFGIVGGVVNDNGSGLQQGFWHDSGDGYGDTTSTTSVDDGELPSPTNGFWRTADWLFCRDNKWRPVESGTFPLVDGAPARVGRLRDFVTPEYSAQTAEARVARLRGYGNAIVAPVAEAFIRAYLDESEG